MKPILSYIQSFRDQNRKKQRVSPLYGSSDAYMLAHLIRNGFFCVIIAESDDHAEEILTNIEAISDFLYGGKIFNGRLFLSDDVETRTAALGNLAQPGKKIHCIVCSKESVGMHTADASFIKAHSIEVKLGGSLSRKKLIDLLVAGGYERDNFVEQPGQVAIRGEIIDVWAPGEKNPYRIMYPGEAVESIRVFEVGTQRSQELLTQVFLFPAKELDAGSLCGCVEALVSQDLLIFGLQESLEQVHGLEQWHTVSIAQLSPAETSFDFQSIPDFQKNIQLFGKTLSEWKNKSFRTVIFSRNTGEMERLQELLYENCRDSEAYPEHRVGSLTRGFVSSNEKIAFVANGDIFGRYHKTFRMPRWTGGKILHSIGDIKYGDYVVHEKYGIGRYRGLEEIQTHDYFSEYIKLEYKNNDFLYVPVEDFQRVQKYAGGEGFKPRLYSMDGIAWERIKRKVKKAVIEMTQELLRTQAKRVLQQGYAFSPLTHMEKEFADSFLYPETPDQARTIQEVFTDMFKARPMDRIVCGDVGYGKTEVAMRAAFKAVNDSCQVAVLVPTTILAEQHYQTFSERMADYPVTISFISRFQKKAEQKKILEQLKHGVIDIIIGTHRLIQKDIAFKNLKLLIVDEEHRFGVLHKERFKKQFPHIDILTLSATPIPRTLHMGLAGVKELSLIETPPEGRQAINTYLGHSDESIIVNAIDAELGREGQIFYVHNRIETILSCTAKLKRLMPSVRFAHVHGRMKSAEIEKTMWLFLHRKIDCLVATSIIESGLDIPNVNTLIVENAQNLGLAQLYQLRGRVGRSKKRAHCFLFYSDTADLTAEARKRLEALREFSHLGSGINLAMRDMEIRGSGNILGARQHGFIKDVGFDLYCRLLKQEVEKQRTGESIPDEDTLVIEGIKINLKVNAFFPKKYIPGETERIRLYRKALACAEEKSIQLFQKELHERFGSMPTAVSSFIELLKLRQQAIQKRIIEINEIKRTLEIHFHKKHQLSSGVIVQLANTYGAHIQFIERGETFVIKLHDTVTHGEDWLAWLKKFLSDSI